MLSGCMSNGFNYQQPRLEIALDTSETTLEVGESMAFRTNANRLAVEGELLWLSDNEDVAVVENGVVLALMPGEAVITVRIGDYQTKVTLTVIPPKVQSYLRIYGSQMVIVGEEISLNAVVTPEMEMLTLMWTTSNQDVATVNQTGRVQGVGLGLVTITAQLVIDPTVSYDHVVYVRNPEGVSDIVVNDIDHYTYQTIGELNLSELNNTVTSIVDDVKEAVV